MKSEHKQIRIYYSLFIIGLTTLFSFSLIWNINKEYAVAKKYAIIEGKASFNKDLLYRRWASMHGGVYVPLTEKTQPNKYLSHIADRDITAKETETKLTLINPAYMTRQVFEIAKEQYGVKGHITSLTPLRPENKADDWETKTLQLFKNDSSIQHSSIENIEGTEYMRFMHAMMVEQSCLKCHADQGYKIGDIRGGISVSVPMDIYNNVAESKIENLTIAHISLYITIFLLSIFGYKKYQKSNQQRHFALSLIVENEARLKIQNEELIKAKKITEEKEHNLITKSQEIEKINKQLNLSNAELLNAKEKAEESDRLKTEFIHNMSHEIRTPMNGILGFSNFLNDIKLSPEKRKNYINIIHISVMQLARTIDDILEISQLSTKQVKVNEKPICLNDLMLEQFSIFDIKAKENRTPLYLKKGLSDLQSKILTDETKLNKIISNLLENAIKFTTDGNIELGYYQKDKELVIYVKDTGVGVSKEKQETIFERFSQEEIEISKNVGGLGLGLSIAKENAELLGGKISLQSEKGKGATFFLTIPYKPILTEDHVLEPENRILNTANEYTILIVEDEETNYLFLEAILTTEIKMNFKIIHAKDGQKAVEICKSNIKIDLVFMDLKMPIMSGFEATSYIKEIRPNLTIIAQSAYTTDEDKNKAIISGCSDFITKPIEIDLLSKLIDKYI